MKNIAILGSTGSVGKQVLRVLRAHLGLYKIFALAADREIFELKSQIEEFKPSIVSIGIPEAKEKLSKLMNGRKTKIWLGQEGLIKIATHPKVDCLVVCTSGTVALPAVIKGIQCRKRILMANKETLIAAGPLINRALKRYKSEFLPLDSEHSAILQCLRGENKKEVKNLILTCSGGPFRNFARKELEKVTAKEVLSHPVWKMGPKITVDSATLMNKGFEVLEAHYLFGIPMDRIKVVVHPECLVHSMVEFVDGTIKAQLSLPDMQFPIQYALFYPKRIRTPLPGLDLTKGKNLSFYKPNLKLFPALGLALEAGKIGGTMPAALVSADQMAVEMFLKKKIDFLDIAKTVRKILNKHRPVFDLSQKEILGVENWVQKQLK